ncbi:MAG: hypothetical protein M3R65_07130 [Gemmatimonadota bacterium]|nr:hypothetical protein [Gemmatimonadota bacterium]
MPRRVVTFAGLALLAVQPTRAQAPDLAPYLMGDRAAEVALARTAAPANVSDSATVLVLTRTGFVKAADGTNGFTCFVLRSFAKNIGAADFWNPRIRAPHCLNAPAVRTVLPEMLKRAEWIMSGVSPAEIATRTRSAYASHDFPMPAAGAMAFMLSPEQYLADDGAHWMPHLMFYYDKSMPAATWGTGGKTNTLIDGSAGDVDSPVLTLLIPVRQWSDGKPAL